MILFYIYINIFYKYIIILFIFWFDFIKDIYKYIYVDFIYVRYRFRLYIVLY